MKKSILNIGRVLGKQEQKEVNGGFGVFFRGCNATSQNECTKSPQCAWQGDACVNITPHIV